MAIGRVEGATGRNGEGAAAEGPGAVESQVRERLEAWVARGGGDGPMPQWVVPGRERQCFEVLIGLAAHESRDVGPLLAGAGRSVGRRPEPTEWLSVVREVSSRQCCLRRSFLAAAVRGLAVGMRESGLGPVVLPEAVLRLREVAAETDAEVAAACGEALAWFRMPAGRESEDGGTAR